jgi:molybdopterin/thiamine biosynthesis adenylyltransferase
VVLASEHAPLNVELGSVDCISGGAIVQAALHALLRIPGLSGTFRVFEPQDVDMSNLNRYSLARRRDVRHPKILGLQRCGTSTVHISGLAALFDKAVAARTMLSEKVLVGTDVSARPSPSDVAQGARGEWRA